MRILLAGMVAFATILASGIHWHGAPEAPGTEIAELERRLGLQQAEMREKLKEYEQKKPRYAAY